jgi:cytochrome c oxidase subunit 2
MIFNLFSNILPTVHCDLPEPWQFSFQDGASPSFDGIVDLHDQIMFYLIIIIILVSWMLGTIIIKFNTANNPIVYKYFVHGTVIELIWTITPALVLVAIAFPSFRLLYLMDNLNFEVSSLIGCIFEYMLQKSFFFYQKYFIFHYYYLLFH